MAKPTAPDPPGGPKPPKLPKSPKGPDPRAGVVAPVRYLTDSTAGSSALSTGSRPGLPPRPPDPGEPPQTDSTFWKKFRRTFLFWRPLSDLLQVSVFGPATVTPGQPAAVSVYLHTPESADSVRTLSRAFHHDAELIGAGYVTREVPRMSELGVHLTVANAGVSKSLLTFVWRGQPHRLVYELHVPWESPGGPAPGIISVGLDNVRVGKIEFRLYLLPRKS